MTLTEALVHWVRDAERMAGTAATGVVVTEELLESVIAEQGTPAPAAAGVPVLLTAAAGDALPALAERIEIAGPDRVSIYVGAPAEAGDDPLGLDPSMPVVFVPVPPAAVDTPAQLEMYNRLRWFGLGPEESLSGSRGG